MGHIYEDIIVSDFDKNNSKKVKALVNTGATLTVLPESIAKELNIKLLSSNEEKVSTGAGLVKIKRGRAWIKLKDKEGLFDIWISDFVDKVLLGVVVLEVLGFEVDPVNGELKSKPLLLYPLQ